MSTRVRNLAHYARWIERRWSEVLEQQQPLVLSSREWELIRDWHARAVPLELIGECIEDAAGRRRSSRGRGRPRALRDLKAAIEEASRLVSASRVQPTEPASAPAESTQEHGLADCLRRCYDATPAGPLRELLGRVLAARAAGWPPEEIDRLLEHELPARVPGELLAAVERELDHDLAAYVGRLPSEQLGRARERARARRLRLRLGLPRLVSSR